MGKERIYNVMGFTDTDAKTGRKVIHSMTKIEMAQQTHIFAKAGTPIVGWYAQTKRGCQMLGVCDEFIDTPATNIKLPKLSKCPICDGQGKRYDPDTKGYHHCPVCNASGVTKKGMLGKWAEWQIERLQKEFGASQTA